MLTNSSPSTSSQEEQMDVDDAINEDQQFHQEQTKQFLLPIELHCEICEFVPLERNANCLLLNHKLSELCIRMIRQQHQLWQQFRDPRLEFMLTQFHPEIVERVQALEADLDNYDLDEKCPWLETEIDTSMANDDLEMEQWIGPQAIGKAISFGTREKAMQHFLWCVLNLYNILGRNKMREDRSLSHYDTEFRRRIYAISNSCKPQPFPIHPENEWQFSPMIRQRLTKEYNYRLDELKAKILNIEQNRTERLQKAKWMQKLLIWDGKVRENIQLMYKYYRVAQAQKNSSDPEKWLKELTKEEKAKESAGGNKQ